MKGVDFMNKESSRPSMKGVDFMKKEWSRPSLEVLDVSMTMQELPGYFDPPNTPIGAS
jgi:hypothetical protein